MCNHNELGKVSKPLSPIHAQHLAHGQRPPSTMSSHAHAKDNIKSVAMSAKSFTAGALPKVRGGRGWEAAGALSMLREAVGGFQCGMVWYAADPQSPLC